MNYSEAKSFIVELKESKLNKDYLIKSKLCILHDQKFSVVYTPFEYLNKEAKIVLIGITPGETQLINSYKAVIDGKTKKEIKKQAAFSGSMRQILINSLNSIWPKDLFTISDSSELFDEKNNYVHFTSILKDAVFEFDSKKQNYFDFRDANKIWKNDVLYNEFETNFLKECKMLPENAVLVCLGDKVFDVINDAKKENLIYQDNIIFIPHPSGASPYNQYYYKEASGDKYEQYQERKRIAKKTLKTLL